MGWKPQYEDLDLIVKQALEWEMKLAIKNQLGREASNRI
jgi:UDP-glucose 4-epimerase